MRPSALTFRFVFLAFAVGLVFASCSTKPEAIQPAATAHEAVIAYHEHITAGDYEAAYQLLSPARPRPRSLESFTEEMETFVPRYEILSIENDLAGNAPEDATSSSTAERCQQLLVEMEVAWDGIEGASPPGTYSYAIIALRGEDGWQLAESNTIPLPLRDACDRYRWLGQE